MKAQEMGDETMTRGCGSWVGLARRFAALGAAAVAMALIGWPMPAEAQHITEFAVPVPSSSPDIAAGPDGALWFTAQNCNPFCNPVGQIGRITTAGSVTTFSVTKPLYIT